MQNRTKNLHKVSIFINIHIKTVFFFNRINDDLFLCGLAGFLLLLGASEAWWWGADLTGRARSITDVTVMDGSRDAIVLLQVNLQK